MLRGLLLLGMIGCGTYRPGAFYQGLRPFAGTRTTVGCLDVAIDRRDDHDKATVLAYRFGNRCERQELVDLAAVRVIGRDASGGEHVLQPWDPKAQIAPRYLDARMAGGEAIAYNADDAMGTEMVQVCVDAGGLVHGPAVWLCFARTPPPEEPAQVLAHEEAA